MYCQSDLRLGFCEIIVINTQVMIGDPMGTNCAPLLAGLFLHPYKANFLQCVLKNKQRKLAQKCYSNFHFIDDFVSVNNSKCGEYRHIIFPNELQVKYILILNSLLLT